ncbi:DUF4280 domain-containing protein [Brevibacillus formosus]|uniref:DUF4280 domain-containing protein n=1 Tax=Brevibacillus TaxID=55080 RepID=UPI000D111CE3|nr:MULTISPECIES: DUF4280 domain-containing protein [Brevibacillus]MBG9943112.1 hypothetical protein [Brevibacillus formosus]MED1946770.1 DUF4280 domain-containing protein [Brevibacillus formosus]MED1997028.1 DUF4280 domain-containing protein [Brevibacillus formosus]MED2084945.1 DUF4280 domain-containing protein [Brevibacillus formosus]PSK20243.1 DUF4280 domain-containing protein [Brevibacillus sp. NRRL NRS-603]
MPMIEDVNVVPSSAPKKSYVVAGAILSCDYGSQKNKLKTPFSHGVYIRNQAQMNVNDYMPKVNIMPFGKCKCEKNPTVAAATAANNGVLKPMPCVPVVTMPWIDGKADVLVENHPALLNTSTNMCIYGGCIRIEDDGQEQS